jgi:WD40 repeat protein
MAQIQRNRCAIAASLFGVLALVLAPALAEDQGPNAGTDLYDRPVLAIDPAMHTAELRAQAVDVEGHFAVTASDDRTMRVWSIADGKLVRTIWIPVGPKPIGSINSLAISPDGSKIAAGGFTERLTGNGNPIYIFDRESGNLIQRIGRDLHEVTHFLIFSPDGRYLAATLGSGQGLRVFDRDKDWSEAFRDDQYGDSSYGAAFARDGRLATTAFDGMIRLYKYDPTRDSPNFRDVRESVLAPSGHLPRGVAFSPNDKLLAIGYDDVAAVDVLDGTTLERVGGHKPADVHIATAGTDRIAWSRDGWTLFADGSVFNAQWRAVLFAWDRNGLGDERRMTYCASGTASGVNTLANGQIFVDTVLPPCVGLMDGRGEPIWTVPSPILDYRDQALRVSQDGQVVDFGYRGSTGPVLRFDVRSLSLSSQLPNDGLTFVPNREGLKVDGWKNGTRPTLAGQALPLQQYDLARSLAVAADRKRFFLGSQFALTAFDDAGAQKWRLLTLDEVWAVNATKDGRVVVTAESDGAIRWHRADDGRELLALQVLPNKESDPAKWDWVLWTPEGFYEATPGAQDVLKWVTNHGPDSNRQAAPAERAAPCS